MTKSHNTAPRTLKEILQTPATKAAAIAGIAATALTGCYGTQAGGQAPEVTVSTELPSVTAVPVETTETPGPTPELMDVSEYYGWSPEQLSELSEDERLAIWHASAALGNERTGRQSYDEFREEYYATPGYTIGKSMIPPAEASLDNSPEDISKNNGDVLLYTLSFDHKGRVTKAGEILDFGRDQIYALIFKEGVNSSAYPYWLARSGHNPSMATGEIVASASSSPIAGKIVECSDIKYEDGKPFVSTTMEIRGTTDTHELDLFYREVSYMVSDGSKVTRGFWISS